MHPLSPTLMSMISEVELAARPRVGHEFDPGELERHAREALVGLAAERPRIVEYLPELAVRRILDRLAR